MVLAAPGAAELDGLGLDELQAAASTAIAETSPAAAPTAASAPRRRIV